jgi:hypothetical protein
VRSFLSFLQGLGIEFLLSFCCKELCKSKIYPIELFKAALFAFHHSFILFILILHGI